MATLDFIKQPLNMVGDKIKKYAWESVVESLITIALGIFLVLWPDTVVAILAYVLGVFFIVKGCYQIISYFMVKGQNNFFNNDLLYGVISLIVGIAAIVAGQQLAEAFRIIIGIWVIYEALVSINAVTKLAAARVSSWGYMLISAIIMGVLGVFIICNQGAVAQTLGWIMIVVGFVSIIGDIIFVSKVDQTIEKITNKAEKIAGKVIDGEAESDKKSKK